MDEICLLTPRLRLREVRPEDWRSFAELFAEADVVRFTEFEPFDAARAQSIVAWAMSHQGAHPRATYALVAEVDGDAAGLLTLIVRNLQDRCGEVGFMLGRPFWGRGYAGEAAARLLAFGFDELRLHRIVGECDPENLASSRLMERLGMRREGWMRDARWEKGAWRDRIGYAILEAEFRSPSACPE